MRGQVYIRPYDTPDGISKLKKALLDAEAVIIGAGAGLSTSAGFTYSGESRPNVHPPQPHQPRLVSSNRALRFLQR